MGEVIVITSGKGGTGKTTLTAGLGAALARLGQRVLCNDCDVGSVSYTHMTVPTKCNLEMTVVSL